MFYFHVCVLCSEENALGQDDESLAQDGERFKTSGVSMSGIRHHNINKCGNLGAAGTDHDMFHSPLPYHSPPCLLFFQQFLISLNCT